MTDEAPITPVSQQAPGPGGGFHDDSDGLAKCVDDIVNDRFLRAEPIDMLSPLHCSGAGGGVTEMTTPNKEEVVSTMTSPSPVRTSAPDLRPSSHLLYSNTKVFGLAHSEPDALPAEAAESAAEHSDAGPDPPLLSPNPKSSKTKSRSSAKSSESIPEPDKKASTAKTKPKRSHSSSSSAKVKAGKDTKAAGSHLKSPPNASCWKSPSNGGGSQIKSPASSKDSKAKSSRGGRGGGRKSKHTTYPSKETIDTDSNDSSDEEPAKPIVIKPEPASPVKSAPRKRSKKQEPRRESTAAEDGSGLDASNLSLKSIDLSHILDDVTAPDKLLSPVPSFTNLPSFRRLSSKPATAHSPAHTDCTQNHMPSPRESVKVPTSPPRDNGKIPTPSPRDNVKMPIPSPRDSGKMIAPSPREKIEKGDCQPFPYDVKALSRRKSHASPAAMRKHSVLSKRHDDDNAVKFVDGVPSIVVSINLSLLDMTQDSLRTHLQDVKVEKRDKNVFEDFGRELGTHLSPAHSSQPNDCVPNLASNADQSDSKPAQHLGATEGGVKRELPDYSAITGAEPRHPPTSLKIPKKSRPASGPRPGSSERSCDGSDWPPREGYDYTASMKRRQASGDRHGRSDHSSRKRFRTDDASPAASSPWNQRSSDYDPKDSRLAQSPYARSPYLPAAAEYGRHQDDFSDRE